VSIYLDGMFYRSTGVGRLYENILEALAGRIGGDRIVTAVPAPLREAFQAEHGASGVRVRFLPYGPMTAGDLFRKSRVLTAMAGEVTLFAFPGHNVPWTVPGRYIAGVNDVTVFSPLFRLPRWKREGFRLLLGRAVRGAEAVVTISEAARVEIARTFRISPERVAVVYPWVKDAFFAGEGPPPARSPVAGEYLLYVGLRIAHKNLDGLVRAFLLVSGEFPTLKLIVAGRRYTTPDMVDRWKADPRLADRLVEILDPSDETLRALYAGARAFVFPSLAEGFGLPPLEAMASGVPVVCSDIPVFREVYGDAVGYVDPNLPESIAEGVRKVLSDPGLRTRLVRSGRERAALYRRDLAVNAYLDMLAGEAPV